MKRQFKLLQMAGALSLVLALVVAGVALAATVIVDTFDDGEQYNCAPYNSSRCPTTPSNPTTADGSGILGGERDVALVRNSGTGYVTLDIDLDGLSDVLSFAAPDTAIGTATLTWDGNDNDPTTLNTSLLNVDLTDGGTNDQFVLSIIFSDQLGSVTIRTYCSATNYSIATANVPIVENQTRVDYHMPFSSFGVGGGTGCQPSSNNARAIQAIVSGPAGQDLSLDFMEVSGGRDYGDLPSTGTVSFDTSIRAASHIAQGLRLGENVDSEAVDASDTNASGDDNLSSPDDEDGIVRDITDFWTPNSTVDLFVTVNGCTGTCRLNGWIDWNRDGDFADTNEQIFNDNTVSNGANQTRSLTVPSSGYTQGDDIYTRFRICPSSGSCNTVTATNVTNGEIEDYYWGFGPTAVELTSTKATATTPLLAGFAAGGGLLAVGGLALLRRRRM